MRTLFRIILGIAIPALLTTSLLERCQTPEDPVGFAYVVGDRANNAPIDARALADMLPEHLPVGSVVSVTGVDGDSDGRAGVRWVFADRGDRTSNNEAILDFRADLRREHLLAVPAEKPEADVLGTISTAAQSISGVSGSKTIVVSDSMLSTAGLLDFDASALLSATGEAVAERTDTADLPELGGYTVILTSVAATAEPQSALPERDRTALEDIWRAVLSKAGAVVVVQPAGGAVEALDHDFAPVSIVTPSEVQSITWQDPCSVIVPESLLRFERDSGVWISETFARATLEDVAVGMSTCTGRLQVAGTTSSAGTLASRTQVAGDRAESGRLLLADILGVDPATIETCALGYVGIDDRDAAGQLVEELAAANRTLRFAVDASCSATR